MSVIIRLQNLPWSANALDIRNFFRGLSIPDGGVHIVGGEMGDAFIAFSTDEDARQAMSMDRGKLNEVQVRLLLSSRAEMQKVIETARNKSLSLQMQRTQQQQQQITLTTPQPPVITSTTLKHIMSNQQNQQILNTNPIQQYQSYSQTLNFENSQENRAGDNEIKSRQRIASTDRRLSRSPSRNQDRRGSPSRSRENTRRRGRERSRSRSRSRDRKTRKSARRSRSRERSSNTERSRWDRDSRDSRDRDSDRNYKDKDKEVKKSIEKEVAMILDDDEDVEQPPIPPPNSTKINPWDPTASGLFGNGSNIMQGYSTISQTINQQQNVLNNTDKGYNSGNQLNNPKFSQFNNSSKVDTTIGDATHNSNILSLSGANPMNYNFMSSANKIENNVNSFNLQNMYNLANNSSFNLDNNNALQSNIMKLSRDQINPIGVPNNMNSFAGIFSSHNKKIEENLLNKSQNDPRIQNNSNAMMMMNNLSRNDSQQKNYNRINFDELRGNCIKVSNMCPSTSYSDIRRFFSGLFIANNGIKMINDKHGLRVGTAFVRFVRPESKPKAFIRNGSQLKNKKITIESVTEEEFDEEIDSYKPLRHFDNNNRNNNNDNRQNLPNSLRSGSNANSVSPSENDFRSDQSPNDDKQSRQQQSKNDSSIEDCDDNQNDQSSNDNDQHHDRQDEETFTILKLREVPIFAKEHDIMKIFSSYTITDIVLKKDDDIKRHLICYVKFHRPEDAKDALKNKSLHVIGHKQIYVSCCTEEKFQIIKDSLNNETIENFNDSNNRNPNKSQNNENISNDLSYDAFNQNCSQNKFNNDDKNDYNINDEQNNSFRNINNRINNSNNNNNNNNNVQPPSLLSLPPIIRIEGNLDPRRRDNKSSRFNNISNNSSDNKNMNPNLNRFVVLRNCDYKLMKSDFETFFGTINLIPERVVILRNNRNQPCGEVIVEFQDDIEAEKSLIKNNTLLSGRTCRMEIIPLIIAANKMDDDSLKMEIENIGGGGGGGDGFTTNSMFGGNRDLFQQNDNFRNNNNSYRQNNNSFSQRGNDNDDGSRGGNGNNRAGNRQSRFSDNDSINGRMSGSGIGGGNNNFNIIANNRRGENNTDITNIPPLNNASVDQFGEPGCVLGLKNVPYKAGTEDILEFFGNFNLGPQNVIRRYNDDGTPTGDARVAFSSIMEARAALESMRNCKIFNRPVFLSIV